MIQRTSEIPFVFFDDALSRLREFAAGVGVELVRVEPTGWGDNLLARAPSVEFSPVHADHLACDYEKWRVFVRRMAPRTASILGGVIHEIGHVAASVKSPYDAWELEWLGWEYAAARRLRLLRQWCVWMSEYTLSDGQEFGTLSQHEQHLALRRAYVDAIENGFVSKRGIPLRVRQPQVEARHAPAG